MEEARPRLPRVCLQCPQNKGTAEVVTTPVYPGRRATRQHRFASAKSGSIRKDFWVRVPGPPLGMAGSGTVLVCRGLHSALVAPRAPPRERWPRG